jgi:TadE-like protein
MNRSQFPRRSRHPRRAGRGRGQSLVEFALVLPLFLFTLFGLIDAARLVYMHSTLSQAAREAARVVAVEAYWVDRGIPGPNYDPSCNQPGGPVCPAGIPALLDDAHSAANRMMTPLGSIPATNVYLSCDAATAPTGAWTTQACNSRATGSLASVRVVLDFQPITPVISQMFPSIPLEASATMVTN